VTGIEEKPADPRSSLIGMGVYYFPKATLGRIGEYLAGPDAKDAPGHYLRWLVGKVKIFGFIFSGLWYDIGDLKSLEEANQIFPNFVKLVNTSSPTSPAMGI
jgi:glucose-1-phosphate thymidylyltransferase